MMTSRAALMFAALTVSGLALAGCSAGTNTTDSAGVSPSSGASASASSETGDTGVTSGEWVELGRVGLADAGTNETITEMNKFHDNVGNGTYTFSSPGAGIDGETYIDGNRHLTAIRDANGEQLVAGDGVQQCQTGVLALGVAPVASDWSCGPSSSMPPGQTLWRDIASVDAYLVEGGASEALLEQNGDKFRITFEGTPDNTIPVIMTYDYSEGSITIDDQTQSPDPLVLTFTPEVPASVVWPVLPEVPAAN